MPRKPSPEREAEFERLGSLTDAIISVLRAGGHLGAAEASFSLTAEANRIRQRAGFTAALEGLRQAFNDALEMARHAGDAQVLAINDELRRLDAPPLAVLLAHRDGRARRLLRKKKKVQDDTEYYLLKEYVVDLASELSDSDRKLAEQLLDEYEHSRPR
jgi:hypothetical protein